MNFLLKYPTRGRPDWFRQTLAAYYSKLSGRHEYRFVVTMDTDDESMNNAPMRNWLNGQSNLEYHYGGHKTKIEACNAGMPDDDWDIVVLVSDDMIPIVHGYDDIIARQMQASFPGLDGVLHFWDGYCGKPVLEAGKNAAPMTLSIVGRKFYDHMGFLYWPAYEGQWCDNDITDLAKIRGKYWSTEQTIIQHKWQEHGKYRGDEVYQKGCRAYQQDGAIYDWRFERKFPVKFSQNDEDSVIRKYFKDRYRGRFLDIGAADGVTFSNTRILYDMGWTGVAVEPSPNMCKAHAEHCPRTKLIPAALAEQDGPLEMYHAPGFVSTTNERHRDVWANGGVQYDKIGVDGICWQTLLANYGCDFDFLNLDIEGENISILKLIPKDYLERLRLVCVEYDNDAAAIRQVVEPFGFKLIHTTSENVLWAK
ncbi:MAG: FkbM family methyltransferase [Planctomycetota bacterium]